jgi:6-phosphofructokinase 1
LKIDKIRDTASSHNRLFFCRSYGKRCRTYPLNAGIGAGANTYSRRKFGIDRLLESLQKVKLQEKS